MVAPARPDERALILTSGAFARTVAVAALLTLVVADPVQAKDSCGSDADCPSGSRCLVGRGTCDGNDAASSSCAVRECRAVAGSPPGPKPEAMPAAAIASLYCVAGKLKALDLALAFPSAERQRLLSFRLQAADLQLPRTGTPVFNVPLNRDPRPSLCSPTSGACWQPASLRVEIHAADLRDGGVFRGTARFKQEAAAHEEEVSFSTSIGVRTGSRCD